jgi:hypothetical protein
VKTLVHQYNERQAALAKLVCQGDVPASMVLPPKIQMKGLFDLDVDNDIWQDIGLDETRHESPLWLSNDEVRRSIRLMHDVINSKAEIERCIAERTALCTWYTEEYYSLVATFGATSGAFIVLNP